MTSDRLTTEDITQNVFLKLFENIGQIESKDSIECWLFKTARNEAFNFYRKKNTHPDEFDVEDADEIEIESDYDIIEILEMADLKEKVQAELNNIPADQKEIFILKEFGNLSYKEIAGILEIDENLVRSRLFKARKKLIIKLSKIIE